MVQSYSPCSANVHIGATWQIRLNLCFLWPTRVHNPNGKSIGSAVSAQLTTESPYTLQWATLSPKIAPSNGVGSGPLSNPWFLEPDRANNPNGITIGSAVFAQVTAVSLYFTMGPPISPQIAPSHGGSGPHLTHNSLGPSEPTNKTAWSESLLVQPFYESSLMWHTDRPRYSVGNNRPHLRM